MNEVAIFSGAIYQQIGWAANLENYVAVLSAWLFFITEWLDLAIFVVRSKNVLHRNKWLTHKAVRKQKQKHDDLCLNISI